MRNKLFKRKSLDLIIKEKGESESLNKVLGVRDLVSLGIAAIVGAGIFSTIGLASYEGGPAISLLFVFVAFACVFTALSYAQFASTIPVQEVHIRMRMWLLESFSLGLLAGLLCWSMLYPI